MVLGLAVGATPMAAFAGGDAGSGHMLFMMHCAACHRADASGGVKLGDTTSADLRAPELETMYHENDELLTRAIMDGIDEDGATLDSVMPRWKGRLSQAQVDDIIAYLRTVMKD